MNILIVEDEGITALFFSEILQDLKHTVCSLFDNADDTLEYLNQNNIVDLIFMDININGSMDGIQLAKKIEEKYKDIHFVFLTSYTDRHTLNEVKSIKPLGYLVKPILSSDIEAILMVVESQVSPIKVLDKDMIQIAGYTYDKVNKLIYENDCLLKITSKEVKCFETLILNILMHLHTLQKLQSEVMPKDGIRYIHKNIKAHYQLTELQQAVEVMMAVECLTYKCQ